MDELQVFSTNFFQRLCEERENRLGQLSNYRFLFFLLRNTIKHDKCELPPKLIDFKKYKKEIEETIFRFLEDMPGKAEKHALAKSANVRKKGRNKILEIKNELTQRWTSDFIEDKKREEPNVDFILSALKELRGHYNYFRKNIGYILEIVASHPDEAQELQPANLFFDLEKEYQILVGQHYHSIAIYSAQIMESRKNLHGAQKRKQNAETRKKDFIELLKKMGLYDREKLGGVDRKTRTTLIEKAKSSLDLSTDRSIRNYLKEILEDLPQ